MDDSARILSQSYFAYDAEALAFQRAMGRAFDNLRKGIVEKYLPSENTQRFRHGSGWSNPGDAASSPTQWETHSAQIEVRFDDVVNNDLSIIHRAFVSFGEKVEKQFTLMLYNTISKAADQVGNVVDARAESSLADAFMAAFEKIEFMADKNGNVSLPELHLAPEMAMRLTKALDEAPQAFRDRFEELKSRKTQDALDREVERKSKFVRYGSPPCVY